MKKLFLGLFFTAVMFAQSTTLSLTSTQTSLRSAAAVTSQLTLANNTTVTSFQFTVTDPNDFNGLTVTIGAAASAASKQITCNTLTSNTETCIVFGLNNNLIGNGVVATLQTNAVSNPSSTSETVSISNIVASTSTASLAVTNTTSSLTFTMLSNCDLNGDGSVNITDVTTEVNWVLGLATPPTGFTADLNGDGKVNVLDVAIEVNAALNQTCTAVTY